VNANEFSRAGGIHGELTIGLRAASFLGSFKNSPFSINFGPLFADQSGNASLNINLSNWNGQPISALGYFQQLMDLYLNLNKAVSSEMHVLIDGNCLCQFDNKSSLAAVKPIKTMADYLALIDKGRKVCARLGINPPWSDAMMQKQFKIDVEEAYGIFFEGGWERDFSNFGVTFQVPADDAKIELLKKAGQPGTFSLESQESHYEILDQKIPIGPLFQEFTEVLTTFEPDQEEPGFINIDAEGTANSKHFIRLGLAVDGKK
jgi:hypothetical protein